MVDRDVPECVAETFVVLGDVQDRRNECTVHVLRVRVSAPAGRLDGGCVESVDIELVDDCVGGRCCDRCDRGIVGGCVDQALRRNLDQQELPAVELQDLGVIAFFDLDHILDLGDDGVLVLHDGEIQFSSLDLALSKTSGLERILDAPKVYVDSPLGQVDDLTCGRVYQRADSVEGDAAFQQLPVIRIEIDCFRVFSHSISSFYPCSMHSVHVRDRAFTCSGSLKAATARPKRDHKS